MKPNCAFATCANITSDRYFDKKMFKFPTEKSIREKWLKNCGFSDLNINKKRLCGKHFEVNCFGKKKLKRGSIPTKNISQLLYDNEISEPKSKLCSKKCCVQNCLVTKRLNPNTAFFSFPKNEIERFRWLNFCNFPLDLNVNRKFICSKHFEPKCIGNKFLKPGAIPSVILPVYLEDFEEINNENLPQNTENLNKENDNVQNINDVDSEIIIFDKNNAVKTYHGPGRTEENFENELTIEDLVILKSPTTKFIKLYEESPKSLNQLKRNKYYCRQLHELKKKNDFYKKEIKNLKEEVKQLKEKEKIDICHRIDMEDVDKNSKEFSKMLLSKPKLFSTWPEEQKIIAQNLNYRSASTYKFMRESLNFRLPSRTSIQRWIPIKKMNPGENELLFKNLKKKISTLNTMEKETVLMFDEVAIRRNLYYNQFSDEVDGLEDFGSGDRSATIAKHICLFMIRCLFSNWKYPLSYYVTKDAVAGDKLAVILIKNLEYIKNIGLNCRAVVADQCPNNRKCYLKLGVKTEFPYFFHAEKKIFAFYDVPHLIKSFRNTLLSSNIITSDGEVAMKVIREVFKLDSSKTLKMCPKITEKHINPNTFEKMRVNLAAQVFSRTFATAIQTCIDLKKISSENLKYANATKYFIEKMNQLFDCLNSRTFYDKNPYKSSIRPNDNLIPDYLKEMITYISGLKLKEKKKNYCFNGMLQSINATLQLKSDIFTENTFVQFIMTSRLNQDPIENMFSQIRSKGGNNKNPTVHEFHYIIARIMSMKILNFSNSKNCEDDDDDLLLEWNDTITSDAIEDNSNQLRENDNLIDVNELDIQDNQNISNEHFVEALICGEITSVADTAQRYYLGYVLFKTLNKLNCARCNALLTKSNQNLSLTSEKFIINKDFSTTCTGYLLAPSDVCFATTQIHFKIYEYFFANKLHIKKIKSEIIKQCLAETKEWFSDPECGEHKKNILDFMIVVLLRKNCKWTQFRPNVRLFSKNGRLENLQK